MTSNCRQRTTASPVSPGRPAAASRGGPVLGLPDAITACLFDMDGVITQTASVHDAAWKEMFDEFLRSWSAAHNQPFVPFDPVNDYDEYVDGKPRLEGTASFLESRGINLPQGEESDKSGDAHHLGPEQQEERPHPRGARARRGEGLRGLAALRRRGAASRPQDGDRVVKRQHRGRAQGGRRGGPVRRPRRRARGRGAPPARQAGARHVPRGGADARRAGGERYRLRGRARRGGRGAGRDISGSSWGWTGSARPTSCARTVPTR